MTFIVILNFIRSDFVVWSYNLFPYIVPNKMTSEPKHWFFIDLQFIMIKTMCGSGDV